MVECPLDILLSGILVKSSMWKLIKISLRNFNFPENENEVISIIFFHIYLAKAVWKQFLTILNTRIYPKCVNLDYVTHLTTVNNSLLIKW